MTGANHISEREDVTPKSGKQRAPMRILSWIEILMLILWGMVLATTQSGPVFHTGVPCSIWNIAALLLGVLGFSFGVHQVVTYVRVKRAVTDSDLLRIRSGLRPSKSIEISEVLGVDIRRYWAGYGFYAPRLVLGSEGSTVLLHAYATGGRPPRNEESRGSRAAVCLAAYLDVPLLAGAPMRRSYIPRIVASPCWLMLVALFAWMSIRDSNAVWLVPVLVWLGASIRCLVIRRACVELDDPESLVVQNVFRTHRINRSSIVGVDSWARGVIPRPAVLVADGRRIPLGAYRVLWRSECAEAITLAEGLGVPVVAQSVGARRVSGGR